MKSFKDYLSEAEQVAEKSVSKAQQRFMGMVYDAKKGGKPASKEVAKAAKGMSKKAAKDFAQTKHKGLPDKVEEGDVTKTPTGIVHKAKNSYGNYDEPSNPGRDGLGKYARDLDRVDKQLTKNLDASMGIKYKSKGPKGLDVDEARSGFGSGSKQCTAEGTATGNIQSMIQKLEDMSELIYQMVPGSKQDRLIDKRDELEARIETLPGGKEALRKWAREYNDSFDEGVAEAMRHTDDPFDDMVEDYLDYLESVGQLRNSREEEKAQLIADLEAGYVHPSEIEYALTGTKWDPNEQGVAEGENTYMPSGDEIAGKDPKKMSKLDKAKQFAKKVANKVAPDDKTLMKDLINKSNESVTESMLIDESGETLDHILNRFKYEVKMFEQGADLDQDLYEALFDYYYSSGQMPYGTAKARNGDPYEWVTEHLADELGVQETTVIPVAEPAVEENATSLDDLARLAGIR